MILFGNRKTESTKKFYADLMSGRSKRRLWGQNHRFNPEAISSRPSVEKYLTSILRQHIDPDDRVLDFGCGPGNFLPIMSKLCRKLTGVDIVPEFIDSCQTLIANKGLDNVEVLLGGQELPFENAAFERVVMIDTIHHLQDIRPCLTEIHRVLKPDGLLLVFEPNKLNPLIWLMHALDPNERGLLRFGSFAAYERELTGLFRIENKDYNGVLLGPSSKAARATADILDTRFGGRLRWLLPKLFFSATKC